MLLAVGGCLPPKAVDLPQGEGLKGGASQGDVSQADAPQDGADLDPGPGQSCNPPAPADASDAALAYRAAVDAAIPGWQQVDANIRATGSTHRNDLPIQVDADEVFLEGLRAIDWPADAEQTAGDLIAVIVAYDEILTTGYDENGYLMEHLDEVAQLDETRAETSHHLRELLGLGPSTCILWRP